MDWIGITMARTREYSGHVLLLITGKSLDPTAVTSALGLMPFQSWRKGEPKRVRRITFQTRHTEGGWKCLLPGATRRSGLASQLKKWALILRPKVRSLTRLRSQGHYCRLVWFAATDATVCLVIPPNLQSALARLGLYWEISILVPDEPRSHSAKQS
jgi:hypothetical protein